MRIEISKESLDELLNGAERAKAFSGDSGLMKELNIRLMEHLRR